jgi:hypothetical protein
MKETYQLVKKDNYFIAEVPSGSNVVFGFRKWTWGEKNTLSTECSSINPIDNSVYFNTALFNEKMFVKTVFKYIDEKFVPFTLEEVHNIDGQLGERLFQIAQKINLVSTIDTQNL